MNQQEILNTIALTRIGHFSPTAMLMLLREVGSATEILAHHNNIREILPTASDRLVATMKSIDEPMRRAEAEMEFDTKQHISPLIISDPEYPERLRQCDDAPLVLFYRGTADLNAQRIISIVGTRQATNYGQEIIRRFVSDMKTLAPDVIIVSGLAYGVDICAHRSAIENGIDTIGVLAHGLDTIYPGHHRKTAEQMLQHGGLITEFLSNTNADKVNFVRRNRIVAGMSDAVILVESAAHGGGLITTSIANSYNRDVMAFPGPVGAEYSEGCNNLIRDNGAGLISSAEDFIKAMGWQSDALLQQAKSEGIERSLFPKLTNEEQAIVAVLDQEGDLQQNILSVKTNLPIGKLTAILFQLEMKGVVRPLAGGNYHLLK